MKNLILQLLLIAIIGIGLNAQESSISRSKTPFKPNDVLLNVPDSIQKKCSEFFSTLISGQTDFAFYNLLKDSPINEKRDELLKLKSEYERANKIYDMLKSYEAVSSEIVTSSYIRVRYLAYHDHFPMRWIFTFYKSPNHGWIVINIKYDDMSDNFFLYE